MSVRRYTEAHQTSTNAKAAVPTTATMLASCAPFAREPAPFPEPDDEDGAAPELEVRAGPEADEEPR